ncbi:MAG: hypothetical protein R2733_17435 [Acidimicrobiales bacterium]
MGKRLGAVDLIDISLSDLGLDHASVAGLVGGDLLPLYFLSGSIVVGFADQWWRIDAPSSVRRIFPAAIGASVTADQPWVVWSNTGQLWFGGVAIGLPQQGRGVMVGNHAHLGVEVGPGHWRIYQRGATSEIRIDDEATGLGLVHLDGLPTLLVQSPGGRLLRLENTAGASKTLTKFSGDLADVAVHPTEPLLAMQRDNGAIDVADLATGEVLLHLGTNRR